MAYVNTTAMNQPHSYAASAMPRRAVSIPVAKTSAAAANTSASSQSTSTTGTQTAVADFRALFSGTVSPAVPETVPKPPTAESVFGATPWVTAPSGQGPGGAYSYNPIYFATPQTAAKVAQMVGGTVVQSNQFTPNGGPFAQSQPNQMVRLADGRMINPGLVASFYTHGYPQYYIDQMIANEVRGAVEAV